MHWASLTLGDRLNNVSFSGGYGYIQSGIKNQTSLKEGTHYNTYPPSSSSTAPMNQGALFSISGIFKVGAKTSFVYDAMCMLYNKTEEKIEYTPLTPGYLTDPNDPYSTYIPETYKYTVTKTRSLHTAVIIMPGMRFQTTDTKAFQFAIAGISIFGGKNGNINFPFPMLSWFQKF